MRMFTRTLLALPMLLLLVACVSTPTATSPTSTAAPISSSAGGSDPSSGQATVLVQQGTAVTPTPQDNPAPAATSVSEEATRPDVVVWWPAALAPAPDSGAAETLDGQFNEYADRQGQTLHIRTKRLEGTGGILSTLRTAGLVAPAALPDLSLLPRESLAAAVSAGLVYPLDEQLPETITHDLFPWAMALGEVDGSLYGVAYTLQIAHIVYRETVFDRPPTTLAAVLAEGQPFAFPAGVENGVNEAVLIQYLAAGGRLAGEDGSPLLDEEPLLAVLGFYEQAVADELVGAEVLEYTSVTDYWDDFLGGALSLALVDSTTYLNSHSLIPNAIAAPILTDDAAPYTLLSGWLWVITTADPDRQAAAIDLLDWLMREEHQFELTHALGWLPSQPGALQMWPQDAYNTLAGELLTSDHLLLESSRSPAATALQTALEAVLRGEQTAADAAAAALAALE